MRVIACIILILNLLNAVELAVQAEGFRNNKGLARIAIFPSAIGFPDSPTNNKYAGSAKIINAQAKIIFPNIPAGEYAISVLHDEDLDGKIKLGFLGIPQEGYGISKQTKEIFGPPKYEDAKTKIIKPKENIKIKIFY